ncbi:HAMP domain-containing sensor histidine kinase [Natrinema sp. 1APR25-10V2]|uniref:sensor histidine kinase n=1 Tax=Natrinema sp. 1APR25-10V2 TaxID=2951081 RepID=UPI0028768169|nr:HAMP domain-containing sensor histidine kinase [Natrinema sp. 1APR25-10V2]MDS0473430.1 HAMP domain-containing histidine kinase [Natrinema sp. 1APR25-10V2]
MTDGNAHEDGDRSRRRESTRSPTSPLLADGGQSRRLFRAFPDPLLYYEIEQDAAVVRAVNPAYERHFDVDEAAITGDRLRSQLRLETAESDPDPGWISMSDTGDATRSDDTDDPDTTIHLDDILPRITAGERVTVELRRGADGDRRHFRLESIPPRDEDAGGYLVYIPITELRRQTETLRTRVDRLERVMRTTAHDIRNPLEVATIRLEAARDTGEEVHFEKVERALDRIQRLIQDVLSVGGGETDPSESVALESIAEAAWSTVETADATLALADDLPTIEADTDALQQVFENLFRNAVEHGGRDVTVTVGSLPDGFYVADDGPGIPGSERDRVFEPGYSTADDNTGLGLAIVQQVADDHGWQVALETGETGGARFEFSGVVADDCP